MSRVDDYYDFVLKAKLESYKPANNNTHTFDGLHNNIILM